MSGGTVLFEPHHDDATLFAAFLGQQHYAHVITVLESHLQQKRGLKGITPERRMEENRQAIRELGLTWEQWPFLDSMPDWAAVERRMRALDELERPTRILAPAVEDGGHEQHQIVAELARQVFGDRVVAYLTYRRGNGKTQSVNRVEGSGEQIQRKLRALACHRSQLEEPSTRPWFLAPLTEYLA